MNKDTLKVMFSSNSNEWYTPEDFFQEINKEFKFELDLAATSENAKCEKFYTAEDDSLSKEWSGICWLNPPYSRDLLPKFIEKADHAAQNNGAVVVCLIPARTDTRYFHKHIYNKYEVRFIKGRLKFGGSKTSAPFPSMLVIFKKGYKNKISYE